MRVQTIVPPPSAKKNQPTPPPKISQKNQNIGVEETSYPEHRPIFTPKNNNRRNPPPPPSLNQSNNDLNASRT